MPFPIDSLFETALAACALLTSSALAVLLSGQFAPELSHHLARERQRSNSSAT